jgi:hypothetical protein
MAKPLTPKMRTRLIMAYDHAGDLMHAGYTAHAVIQSLVANHNATFGYRTCTQVLRCAGIEVSNTSGDTALMLNVWMARASTRLEADRVIHNAQVPPVAHAITMREAIHAAA